jgi:ATP-dependent Lon protease
VKQESGSTQESGPTPTQESIVPNKHRRTEEESLALADGYELRTLTVFYKDRLTNVQILLPEKTDIDDLVRDRSSLAADAARAHDMVQEARRFTEREEKERAAKASELFAQVNAKADGEAPPPSVYPSTTKRHGKPDFQVEKKHLAERHQCEQDAHAGKPGHTAVYAWDEPLKLIKDADVKSPDRDWRERDQELYQRLAKAGSFRKVGGAPTELEDIGAALRSLGKTQPHFAQVVDLVLGQVLLAKVKGTPLHLPPILLAGPPGVGKTHFTLELARALARPMRRHSLDVSHTSSSLMGSARNWANTHLGLVFDMVCLSERADPLILLDELDKARRTHNADPLAPLHSLLEPLTSTKVADISAGIEFNTSHIFWVATANDLYRIPEPIKSRFRVFNIALPTAEQAIALAQAVGLAVHQRMNQQLNGTSDPEADKPPLFTAPSPRLYSLLAHLTPREQIQALEHAYARALANGRRQVLREDLPAEVLLDDGDPVKPAQHLH